MATKDYATTCVSIPYYHNNILPDPEPPNYGDSWKLVSSAANADTLFWFWERTVSKTRYTLTIGDECGIYEDQFDTLEEALADAKAMYPDIPKDWDGLATCVFGTNHDAASITTYEE
jgi:hypothetical protein